jgi:hypothetical protein
MYDTTGATFVAPATGEVFPRLSSEPLKQLLSALPENATLVNYFDSLPEIVQQLCIRFVALPVKSQLRFLRAIETERCQIVTIEQWGAFLKAWHEKYGTDPVGVKEVLPIAQQCGLIIVHKGKKRSATVSLGSMIRLRTYTPFSGFYLVKTGTRQRAAQYRCEKTMGDSLRF